MKVTFIEELEHRTALNRNMYCGKCGSHSYCIHHQLQPDPQEWWIECEDCGFESYPSPTRVIAIGRWKQAHYDGIYN